MKRRRPAVWEPRPVVEPEFQAWVEGMGGTMLVAPRVIAAFMRLREAWSASLPHSIAEQAAWDPWSCAVSLGILREDLALTDAEIRGLVDHGLVEFRLETARDGQRPVNSSKAPRREARRACEQATKPSEAPPGDRGIRRTFRKTAVLTFAASTCFIATQAGVELCSHLQSLFTHGKVPLARAIAAAGDGAPNAAGTLKWHGLHGLWTRNDRVIKKVAKQAKTQRRFLAAGQAVNWVNPIPNPDADMRPKKRQKYLSRVLSLLNHQQKQRHVHLRPLDEGRSFTWVTAD